MNKSQGSWSGGPTDSRKASEHDLRFGHQLLTEESKEWPPYFAVVSRTAYSVAEHHLSRRPEDIGYALCLDWGHLQALTNAVPNNVELIVAMGGGTALDASKYVALSRNLPLVLVPTAVSSGAIIHSVFAKWEGHATVGPVQSWPWLDFDHVIIDYDLILKTPYYLNTAGLGDVLCGYAGIAEWRRNSKLGIGPLFDESVVATMAQHHAEIVNRFPNTLDAAGNLTPDSVRFIMESVRDRDHRIVQHSAVPGGDHTFWLGAEEVNNNAWIHGEFVALAAVLIAWHCGESPDMLAGWLDTCKVRWRPDEIGVTRQQLSKALEYAPAFMADSDNGRDVRSILRLNPIVGLEFDNLWDYLQHV